MLRTFIEGPGGQPYVNPGKLYLKHFTLLPDNPNEVVTVAAAALSPPLPLSCPQEGPVELFEIVATATSMNFRVAFFHRKRELQNYPVHATTMLGGPIPGALGYGTFFLPQPLWLLPRESLVVQFTDLSGQDNDIRFATHGRMYVLGQTAQAQCALAENIQRAKAASVASTPFFYTTVDPPLTVAANAQVLNNIHIGADGAFELHKISSHSTGAYTIQLFDPLTGRYLTSGPVHSALITGTGHFPYILPEPLFMKRNSEFRLVITDLSGAPNDIHLTFAGRRIFSGDERL